MCFPGCRGRASRRECGVVVEGIVPIYGERRRNCRANRARGAGLGQENGSAYAHRIPVPYDAALLRPTERVAMDGHPGFAQSRSA